jgi:hypothetical protein
MYRSRTLQPSLEIYLQELLAYIKLCYEKMSHLSEYLCTIFD